MINRRVWAALMVLAAMAASSSFADAASCTATTIQWNPDPYVSNANPCGAGTTVNNSSPESFNGITFTQWDKDEPNDAFPLSSSNNGTLLSDNGFYFTGLTFEDNNPNKLPTTGYWFWNAKNSLAAGNDVFAIVLKDGGEPKWAWFILDNPVGAPGVDAASWLANPIQGGACGANNTLNLPYTHCGEWGMYGIQKSNGDPGKRKGISHMSIYGADTVQEVPEPAALTLLGLGLVGVAVLCRRRLRRPTTS